MAINNYIDTDYKQCSAETKALPPTEAGAP